MSRTGKLLTGFSGSNAERRIWEWISLILLYNGLPNLATLQNQTALQSTEIAYPLPFYTNHTTEVNQLQLYLIKTLQKLSNRVIKHSFRLYILIKHIISKILISKIIRNSHSSSGLWGKKSHYSSWKCFHLLFSVSVRLLPCSMELPG